MPPSVCSEHFLISAFIVSSVIIGLLTINLSAKDNLSETEQINLFSQSSYDSIISKINDLGENPTRHL